MAMNLFRAILLLSSLPHVFSMTSHGRKGHGLIGYGISMYHPPCAHACRDTISGSALNCSTVMVMDGESMAMSDADCYATDEVYLQTLAYCISTHCEGIPTWELEYYWATYTVGRDAGQPSPRESYQTALEKVKSLPTEILVTGDPLNKTSLVNDDDWVANYNGDSGFEKVEINHERYAIVVLVTGAAIPIALSLLRFVPFPTTWITVFNCWFIYPPAFGKAHNEAVLGLFHMPTRGQALFITYLFVVNLVLTFVGISTNWPNSWYSSISGQWKEYIANRVGVLSFANLPLLILFASRNNVLLWVTDWSHSTFLLVHRWVAFIATIQACLHSVLYLQDYLASGEYSDHKLAYWIWGAVATVGMSVLLPTSLYPIRKRCYEVFLAWHVVIAILVVIGCYYHILLRFQHQWGYETWVWVAMAVWGFERAMRLFRIARNGLRRATVSLIDDQYVRVDVPGVTADGHAYLYFPTLTWRIWENHPFSIMSTVTSATDQRVKSLSDTATTVNIEKSGETAISTNETQSQSSDGITRPPAKAGLTFLLRTQSGLTSALRVRVKLPVLVESGYGTHEDLSSYSRLLCIAGGVGITSCVPYMRSHPGQVRLLWGVRTKGIVDEMAPSLAGIDKDVYVGKRMRIPEVLEREIGEAFEKVAVLVSGPNSMADEVRFAVARLGREKKVGLKLIEEAFSW